MSYLTFKIISIAVMFLILLTAIITRNTDVKRGNRRLIAADERRKREESRGIAHPEWYQSDFKKVEFFDDSKSSDPEKKRVGSHFWIESRRESDGVQLSLCENNWGAGADYMMSGGGFVESYRTVKEYDMQRLMVLCDFAQNGGEVVEYLHKRFSPDGYNAYLNILDWFDENNIETSSWMNW